MTDDLYTEELYGVLSSAKSKTKEALIILESRKDAPSLASGFERWSLYCDVRSADAKLAKTLVSLLEVKRKEGKERE